MTYKEFLNKRENMTDSDFLQRALRRLGKTDQYNLSVKASSAFLSGFNAKGIDEHQRENYSAVA